MEEKRKDLKISKQRKLIQDLLPRLAKEDPNLYYLSTSEIAIKLVEFIEQARSVRQEEKALLKGLSHQDIQMILSLH